MRRRLPFEEQTGMTIDEKPNDCCQVCGREARVRTLANYEAGKPVFGLFCLECADHHPYKTQSITASDRSRLSFAFLLFFVGIFVVILGAWGDCFGIHDSSGFGWYQRTGIAIGGFVLLLGAMFRVEAMAVIGAVVFGLAALSDVFGLGDSAGIGWKQQLLIVIGLALALTGLWLRRRIRSLSRESTGERTSAGSGSAVGKGY